jgi:TolA protein
MRIRRLHAQDKGLRAFIAASLVVHLLVIIGNRVSMGRVEAVQPVYNVHLVTSAPGGGARAPEPVAKGEPQAKAEQAKAPAAEAKAAPPAPKAEAKPVKTETRPVAAAVKPAPAAKTVPKAVEKKEAASKGSKAAAKANKKEADSAADLASALADVKKMIKGKGSADGSNVGKMVPVGEFGAGQGGREVGALAMQIYAGQVQTAIQQYWSIPRDLAQTKAVVQLGLKVAPDGQVLDVWIDEKSSVPMFDESALRAVKKASPLPPPPQTKDGVFIFYSRFTPQGATRSE